MSEYGLPYQGSKGTIAEKLCSFFPKADNFYDLFGGGGAISHCMLTLNKYKTVHYNEISLPLVTLFKKAINGDYNYDKFKPEWISREEFFKRKDADAYIATCWSFGNNNRHYIFSKEIEPYKRSMHNAIVFGEFDELAEEVLQRKTWTNKDIKTRRLFFRNKIEHYRKTNTIPDCLIPFLNDEQRKQWSRINGSIQLERLQQLQELQQLEQLRQLQQLQQLQQLERLQELQRSASNLIISSGDYRDVPILPNSVVYCDIPYENTKEYASTFNKKEFLDWAATRDFPVYISEFNIADPRFQETVDINKRGMMAGANQKVKKLERLYWNKKKC